MSIPRSLFFLLLFLAALAATAAGDAATWLEREHDFGMIDEANGKVACTMRLVNTTDSMLSIIEVRPSCGCTAVRYPRQPIAPADTAALILVFNPHGRPGTFAKSVVVRLSQPPMRSSLIVRGTVRAAESTLAGRYPALAGPLRLSNSLAPMGEVQKGRTASAIISGYNTSTDTLSLSADSLPAGIAVQFAPQLLPPGEECHIVLSLDSSKHAGLQQGVLELPIAVVATPLHPTPLSTMCRARVTVVANIRNSLSSTFSAF